LALIVIFCLSFHKNTHAEKRLFDVFIAGFKVGSLVATKVDSAEFVVYSLETKVHLWFFKTVDIHHRVRSVFSKGVLVQSRTRIRINKDNYYTNIDLKNNVYDIEIVNEGVNSKFKRAEPITQTISTMYFERPKNPIVFGETYCADASMKWINTQNGELFVNKQRHYYTFLGNELVEAELESKMKDYIIRKHVPTKSKT